MAFRYPWKWAEDPSKLNKVELLKLNRDGLDILDDIERLAQARYKALTEDDLQLLKWAGVYAQRPKEEGYFMVRIRVPSGVLNSRQAREVARISREYGRSLVDVTTRQCFQLHWVRIENFPDIFKRLADVGLFTYEACGDCPRNIVGNPLAGIDPHELIDTRPIVEAVQKALWLNREFSNLPRKYKISISANIYNAAHAEINDLAFTPATKVIDGQEVVGFHVWVGGGLSSKPHMAQQLDMFVRPEEVVKVAVGVTRIFRDYGYREKRHRVRLKFLVADWGVEKFQEVLEGYIGKFPGRGEDKIVGWNAGYFTGVHRQKQEGLYYVGLSVPLGRMNADELEELADLADKYGNGSLRTCNTQNILITHVPEEKVEALLAEPLLQRITPFPKPFSGHAVSCTGIEFCNLALTETKERMRKIVEYLDARIPLDTPIRLHINGCPNSCGQQQIADIGLQGALVKTPEGMKEAYDIAIGGRLGPGATFNTRLKGRVLAEHVPYVLEALIRFYRDERQEGEDFHAFVRRVGVDAFQAKLDEALAETVSGASRR